MLPECDTCRYERFIDWSQGAGRHEKYSHQMLDRVLPACYC
jgi:hypothetical protein